MTREVVNTNKSAAPPRAAAAAAQIMLSPKIIALEEGWNNEIKAKAIDVLASA